MDETATAISSVVGTARTLYQRAVLGVTYVRAAERKALASALAVLTEAEMARALAKLVTVVPLTSTGALDPRTPTGVPTAPTPDIVVAAPIDFASTDGTAFSQNLASYVTGADASGYVMSLVAVTGTLVGIGLSLSTTTVSGTAAQGSFTYRLRVTKSGYTFDAPSTSQIVVAAAPSADNVAPSVPRFLTATPNNTTPKVALAGDYPMDVRSGAIPPTDPVKVEISKSTDGGAYSVLTTKTAPASQPAPVMALSQIGTVTAGGSSVSGANITINGVVDGNWSHTEDKVNFYGGLVTLPVGARVFVTIPDFSVTAYDYAEARLVVRQSLTTLDRCVAMVKRSNGLVDIPMLSRATLGGTITGYTGDLQGTGSVELCIERQAGDLWQGSTYINGAIVTLPAQSVIMTGQLYVGVELHRGTAGGAVSVTFANFSISINSRWTYDDTAVSVNHTYAYKTRGGDSA